MRIAVNNPFTAAASAAAPPPQKEEVLIYSFTEKSTEYIGDINDDWEKSTRTSTGYMVVGEGASSTSLSIWTINTWKDTGADGKRHNYAHCELPINYSFVKAHLGDKDTWLLGLSSLDEHTLLKGEEKRFWIPGVDKTASVPKAFSGTRTWQYTDSNSVLHAGSSTISIRLHSKFTNDYYSNSTYYYSPNAPLYNAWGAAENIEEYLQVKKGYIVIPTIIP